MGMTNQVDQTGQAIAEMWMLGSWKMRGVLLRRLWTDGIINPKRIGEMILIACFTDICGMYYGRKWVVSVVHNKWRKGDD